VNARHARFPLVDFGPEALAAADVVVVLVDHPEFDPAVIAEHSRWCSTPRIVRRRPAWIAPPPAGEHRLAAPPLTSPTPADSYPPPRHVAQVMWQGR
jgi:hypothetical protein